MSIDLDKKLTANQLYKIYKEEGGTLNFSEWLNREKAKGVFPINAQVNDEVNNFLANQKSASDMKKTVLGFPVSTLLIASVIIIGAVVYTKYYKNKQ
jgi:hypothetical protein